ncbi:MAG TPA: hypothetical protein PLF15_00615 [bacterium]|nr:hypothetical protein [bacterium]
MNNEPLVNLGNNNQPLLPNEPKIYTMPTVGDQTPASPPPTPPISPISSTSLDSAINSNQPFNLKNLGSLFSQTIKMIWQKKWRFLYLNIVPKIIGFLLFCIPLALIIVIFVIMVLSKGSPMSSLSAVGLGEIIFIVLGVIALLLMFFGFIYGVLWSQAAYIHYLQTQEISKRVINKASRKKIWGLLGTTIIAGFMAFGWFILFMLVAVLWSIFVDRSNVSMIIIGILSLVFIVYSIIRSIRFSLAGIVKLMEGLPAVASVRRSKSLVFGYSWPIFKRQIMLGYLQFIIQIASFVSMALIFWFGSVNKLFLIIAIILGLVVFLFMLLISSLLEPFNYAYYYDIYQNLSAIKNKDVGAKEKHSLGYKLGILGLLVLLPLLWIGMFFLNLILNSGVADLSAVTKLTPLLSGPGLNFNSSTNLNLENLDNTNITDQSAAFDFLKTLSDENVQELNNYSNQLFKELPGNPNKEDLPIFNTEEFRQLLNTAGFDADKIMAEFSLEKQKFIWNSFYIGMSSSDPENQALDQPANGNTNNLMLESDSDIDSDNDSLTDIEEEIFGTDLNNPDSDGDGYLDGEEVLNGYNPMGPGKLIP